MGLRIIGGDGMTSTMECTLAKVDGVVKVVPREFPNWYGIEEIGFIWNGNWADPEIEYKGKRCSCYAIEDTMWSRFLEEYPDKKEDEFEAFMWENENEVIELCEHVLFGKEI